MVEEMVATSNNMTYIDAAVEVISQRGLDYSATNKI